MQQDVFFIWRNNDQRNYTQNLESCKKTNAQEKEYKYIFIVDNLNLSCNKFEEDYCGIHLFECDNGKEYKCVTNLIEVKK